MICDKCKVDITCEDYSKGGNCPECGNNLCNYCAGGWKRIADTTVCADCAKGQEGNNG